jgi:hypothetical protein
LPKLKVHGLDALPSKEMNRFIEYRKKNGLPYR